jgi:hypothetical protein
VADTVLRFSASGVGPDEAVEVRVNTPDGFAVGKLHTDSVGTVRNAGQFRIPFSLKGRNTFVLTGEQSHTSTTVTFTVEPYQPTAAPSSYGGRPGTQPSPSMAPALPATRRCASGWGSPGASSMTHPLNLLARDVDTRCMRWGDVNN